MFNSSNSFWSAIPPVVKNLLLINVILWLATLALPRILAASVPNFDLSDLLGMHYWSADRFRIWQLLSYMFMHSTGGITHLFFNMFALFMFGVNLERLWGSRRFLIFYIATGVGAAVVQQLIWTMEFQPLLSAITEAARSNSTEILIPYEAKLRTILHFPNLSIFDPASLLHMKQVLANAPLTVGASGAVFGMLFAFGWLFPQAKMMFLFIPYPIPARIFVAIYAVIELFLGVANFSGDNVAHFAHLGGMLFGWLIILYWRKCKRIY